jgi:hypothetical protein
VHLIPVPDDADGLCRALAPLHHGDAGIIHARHKRIDGTLCVRLANALLV